MSESSTLIADSIHRIFADAVDRTLLDSVRDRQWPQGLWRVLAGAGFTNVLGADGPASDWQDAEAVLFALGYHRAPVPLAETMLARWLIARAGGVSGISDADVLTVVDGSAFTFERTVHGWSASGKVAAVPWARHAEALVISGTYADAPALALLRAGAPGLSIVPGTNLADEPRDAVHCAAAPVELIQCDLLPGLPDQNPVRVYGALLRATAMAGAATSVLDQAVLYANDRTQFGRPIGKFQAVQTLLAEVGTETAAGTMAVAAACAAAGGPGDWLDIAVAKVRAGQMATRVTRHAHQVHGAIGLTQEHSLHYGTRRLWAWRSEYGRDADWARLIGETALAAGGAGLWERLMVGTG